MTAIRPVASLPFLEARMRLRSVDDCGRSHSRGNRYRPNWLIPNSSPDQQPQLVSGVVENLGAATLATGEEGVLQIYPLAPEQWRSVHVGTAVEMTEGPFFVTGAGIVTDVSRLAPQVTERDGGEGRFATG